MRRVRTVSFLLCLAAAVGTAQEKPQKPQQPPTFRTGVNLVRVDAYPSRDGKIVEGLTVDDFEVLEDGVRQKVESFQFVEFEQNAPLEERRDPNSQREAFELAADPARRVFVLYLDNLHVSFVGSHRSRVPLTTFMNRVLNPRDLFGVMTTVQRPEDLMLGAQSQFIEEQLDKYWDWGVGARVLEDDEDMMLSVCYPGGPNATLVAEAKRRRKIDAVLEDLEGLATLLAGIREERKNILLISGGWGMSKPDPRLHTVYKPSKPEIGVTSPRGPGDTGVGRITLGARNSYEVDMRWCEETLQRLLSMDFDARFREFIDLARRSNVTFYTMNPAGLQAPFENAAATGQAHPNAELNAINNRTDELMTLANNTDGIPIVNTNDLTNGARRIADDLSATYILGYYPTNSKADGRLRKITVRVKGLKGDVRARREYRALSEAEMATMREVPRGPAPPPAPSDDALADLKRLRPGAPIHTRGTVVGGTLTLVTELTAPEIEAGRWKEGADVQVVVTAASGETVAMSKGRIEAGARAAVMKIPIEKAAGPFHATLRIRSTAHGTVDDSLAVARRTGAFGDPLIFRLAAPSQPRPAGSVYFRRTERMQVRWPITGTLTQPTGRILGRDGVPLELALPISEKEEDGVRYVVADLNLAPLTQAEYVLEVQGVGAGGATESARLAFRVFR